MTLDSPFTQDSPLSLQGEGWGEGALEPSTIATGKHPSRASSLLRKAKARPFLLWFLLLGLPEKPPSAPERPFRRPSETRAQEVMRHGCRESPAGYRDVPSGRASVAGEFVRVARLYRARMLGQAFLVPFVAFDKRDSPEGAKQEGWANSERRRNTQAKATGFPRSRE